MTVKRIQVERVEGSGGRFETGSFEAANSRIAQMARTAPQDGSYHKTDFKVEFEDGQQYAGRIDLTHEHRVGFDLREHMLEHCRFMGGLGKPRHMTQHQYETYLHEAEVDQNLYRQFISKYLEG